MIKRWSLAVAILVSGCGLGDDPQVRVTLNSITVTSVDTGSPGLAVFGEVTAASGVGYSAVGLFDHDIHNPVPLNTGVQWPTQGIVGQGVVVIPTHDLDPPYEIDIRYDATVDYNDYTDEKLSVPYVDGMSEQIGFNVHRGGGILLQLTLEEM